MRRSAQTPSVTVPLAHGRELRLVSDGERCDLQSWSRYPDGRAMMSGGFKLNAGELRVLLHALRYALWDIERTGLRLAATLPQPDDAAA